MPEEETVKCAYCGKERPKSEMHQGEITFIGWNGYKKGVMKETNWYCKDKPCHGYDQMGHEG